MIILFEYSNNKKTFYTIYEHHFLFANYEHVELCPTRNEDKSVSLTYINIFIVPPRLC